LSGTPTTSADVESTGCPLCGAAPPSTPSFRFAPYAVVRCGTCSLWYLSPRLVEARILEAYRSAEYFQGGDGPGYSSYLAQEASLRRTFRRLLDDLARLGMTGGRLLEVGCAYGFFLDEAKPYFDHRAGTDFAAEVAARARLVADEVFVGGLEQLGSPRSGGAFDLAVLIHTIEHVYDPKALVNELLAHLKPGGWVVLATPDMGGFWRPLLGRRWPFFKAPEHVVLYDRRTLGALLTASGCDIVRPVPYVSYFPLSLVAEKLSPSGIGKRTALGSLGKLSVRVPATTVAAAGRKSLS
jgi:SAM-dependent methyltransferase